MSPHFWPLLLSTFALLASRCLAKDWVKQQYAYVRNPPASRNYSPKTLNYVADMMEDMEHFNEVLDNILVPRVCGTKGHDTVRDYIIWSMKELGWQVKLDSFNDTTNPLDKVIQFDNIIATLNPHAQRRLILACHYDSKMTPKGFLGATDSAVPCAITMNLAKVMKEELNVYRNNNSVTLQLVFFDGEEAFVDWTNSDSLYGARHLANKWNKANLLGRIDILVLLDLLGAKGPTIWSSDTKTTGWFAKLSKFESLLMKNGFINTPKIFERSPIGGIIQDDHIPFMRRDVPVLHLISFPFPDVWHTIDDNFEVVHQKTVETLNKVMRLFVWEYLRLD